MAGQLQDRCALVTGAGQGVGRGIAIALAYHGAALALVGRTESKAQAVAEEVNAGGGRAVGFGGDVTSPADLERCVAATVEGLGGLDILVNNAQQFALGTMLDVTDEQIQACWESGPLATFRLMRLCYPHLRGGGVVVNVGSGTSVNPVPTGSPSSADPMLRTSRVPPSPSTEARPTCAERRCADVSYAAVPPPTSGTNT